MALRIFIEPEGKGPHQLWYGFTEVRQSISIEPFHRIFNPWWQRGQYCPELPRFYSEIQNSYGQILATFAARCPRRHGYRTAQTKPNRLEQLAGMGWSYGEYRVNGCSRNHLIQIHRNRGTCGRLGFYFGSKTFPTITREYFSKRFGTTVKSTIDALPLTGPARSMPLPLLHGALDPRVAPSQSCLMERLLRLRGVETEFHLFQMSSTSS